MPDYFKIFEIHTVRPASILKTSRVRMEILRALQDQGEEALKMFYQTVEQWNDPPEFEFKRKYAGGDIHLLIGPVDDGGERGGYKKWYWLNRGTSVRHAKLSKDWESKTQYPGSLGTNTAGQGEVLKISKRYMYPGIKARKWTLLIRRRMKNRFPRAMDKAIKKGLKP